MEYSGLLDLLWRAGWFSGRSFTGVAGEHITVLSSGEPSDFGTGVWHAAEIETDGVQWRGSVVIGEDTSIPDGAVLRVVAGYAPPVLGAGDRLVPQIGYSVEPRLAECYDSLRAGAGTNECAELIADMSPLHRTALFTALSV